MGGDSVLIKFLLSLDLSMHILAAPPPPHLLSHRLTFARLETKKWWVSFYMQHLISRWSHTTTLGLYFCLTTPQVQLLPPHTSHPPQG